ncbi:MAG: hypothetical protein OEW18_08550, partial [Candidatus Aminicenantes bacterium]|nr:hypothetical protein [Candidatus Aminicenantes bacterium]
FTSERPADDRFGDLYISFRTPDAAWTPARNMGKGINGQGPEFGTILSPDGKFLFFTRQTPPRIARNPDRPLTYDDYLKMHNSPDNASTNIWWVDAGIIEHPKSEKPNKQ